MAGSHISRVLSVATENHLIDSFLNWLQICRLLMIVLSQKTLRTILQMTNPNIISNISNGNRMHVYDFGKIFFGNLWGKISLVLWRRLYFYHVGYHKLPRIFGNIFFYNRDTIRLLSLHHCFSILDLRIPLPFPYQHFGVMGIWRAIWGLIIKPHINPRKIYFFLRVGATDQIEKSF